MPLFVEFTNEKGGLLRLYFRFKLNLFDKTCQAYHKKPAVEKC